jgi:hypothetical protein
MHHAEEPKLLRCRALSNSSDINLFNHIGIDHSLQCVCVWYLLRLFSRLYICLRQSIPVHERRDWINFHWNISWRHSGWADFHCREQNSLRKGQSQGTRWKAAARREALQLNTRFCRDINIPVLVRMDGAA